MVSADRIDSHKLKKLVTAVSGSEEKAAKKSGVTTARMKGMRADSWHRADEKCRMQH
jgi:hypothetical protein